MKTLKILAIISSLILSNLVFAQEEKEPEVSEQVTPIKEITVENLDFNELSKEESMIGCLAEYVKKDDVSLESFLAALTFHKHKIIMHPHAEGLAYVNGRLCHIGNYPQSIIYTVLEGPHYGLQTTTALNGLVLYINHKYKVEYTPHGVILHHYYSDSEVITGSNQVITFY